MEQWQGIYLILLAVGFGIGYYFTPLAAVGFIWISIITTEAILHRRELKEKEEGEEI